ncbi:MarR family winged helix-turn-helix transcriptional regulator [Lentilactobacillus kisonensis]|uniref:Transcriptional regulator, MarR family n=2 Tax=Lentilactobacillus kisonensis TaxID=481722 RepID=H1LJ83_9LACO|nr:MarR family transcriptional regulator [Lentilactobacillus kisonensis]EHO48929.1 transcriptional regulator, MarR family [Lentilactobacillus kisonensis F0435]KRL23050.1 transcriptional regulator, MarR family [Lentilactobacillus kisonensis DSM 19906 = JCM 15041]
MTKDNAELLRKIFGFIHGTQRMAQMQDRPYHMHGQHRALAVLAKEGTLIQSQLAEILDIRPSSLTELLSKLEDRGLITRTADEDDKRVTKVSITDDGRKLIENDHDSSSKMLDTLFEGLSADEITELSQLFDKLNASLKEKLPKREEGPHGFPHHHHGFGGGGRGPFGGPHGRFHGPRGSFFQD